MPLIKRGSLAIIVIVLLIHHDLYQLFASFDLLQISRILFLGVVKLKLVILEVVLLLLINRLRYQRLLSLLRRRFPLPRTLSLLSLSLLLQISSFLVGLFHLIDTFGDWFHFFSKSTRIHFEIICFASCLVEHFVFCNIYLIVDIFCISFNIIIIIIIIWRLILFILLHFGHGTLFGILHLLCRPLSKRISVDDGLIFGEALIAFGQLFFELFAFFNRLMIDIEAFFFWI